MRPKKKASAFTLVEVIVASTIIGFVVMGAVLFMHQAYNVYYYDSGRLYINRDLRKFTQDMASNAVLATFAQIYPSYTNYALATNTSPAAMNYSGNMLLLFTETTNVTTGQVLITQIRGYYVDTSTSSAAGSPLRTFATNVNTANGTDGVPDTLNASPTWLSNYLPASAQSTNPLVIEYAKTLSTDLLFTNYLNHGVIVKGQFSESGDEIYNDTASTYNFTVSPRGG